jgi:D-lactate dehydrogenase
MRVAVFNTKSYDRQFLLAANDTARHELVFFEPRLSAETSKLAQGFPVVCAFVNDTLDRLALVDLAASGTKLIALRCAGFNQVDLTAAAELGMRVVRVPAYSPYAVAEHAIGLMLALNRKIHKAYARVREGNFSLEGLLGFDLHGRAAGVIGTGKIGAVVARILHGFGCHLLVHDKFRNAEVAALGARYVPLDELFAESDIITLHCPLTPETYHLINAAALAQMKPDVMLINTSRGALIDTAAVVAALKERRIGYLGLDVYEEEGDLFFDDLSGQVIQDDLFTRLVTFPNVLVTGHQAFFTRNALEKISAVTLDNITAFERGQPLPNEVIAEKVKG